MLENAADMICPMPRPFTRAQALENAAFLRALRKTGNVREAARRIGEHRAKFTRRRTKHPLFAAEWDAALAVAHAALHDAASGERASGRRAPTPSRRVEGAAEPKIIRTRTGRLQLRRVPAGRLTHAGEQAFLAALSATANVRLAAAAAGFSHSAFYARRRQNPVFAREMRLALELGYERLQQALIKSVQPASHRDDAWRHNDPPAVPPMTPDQALQLLWLHERSQLPWTEHPATRRRRGETLDMHSARLALIWEAKQARLAEDDAIREAARAEGPGKPK